jgi:hypothetical protein
VDAENVRKLLRERSGVRIGPRTSDYVLGRLLDPPDGKHAPIAVMGGDARTGAAIRTFVEPAILLQGNA